MPFYEYECQSCKFYIEVMQKISDPPLVKCPSCGKRTMTKLMSAPVFRLKGSGWYETDFKSDKEEKRNLAEREEPKPVAEESKSESKPESTAPAAEGAAKPAEAKTPSVTTTAATSVAAPKHRGAAARKRPVAVAAKASARPSAARAKGKKPAGRAKGGKRAGRR